ncbi:MAG: UDP-N-acetylglucosamine transferase subunit [Alyxoria varia]|nr:MAG: UDP-N-acetylglucosamine transferase subunit [Alyxoria varia]
MSENIYESADNGTSLFLIICLTILFVLVAAPLILLVILANTPSTPSKPEVSHTDNEDQKLPQRRKKPTRLLVVLGSGGHTTEMLMMLDGLETHKYTHRSYVVSSGDSFSSKKALAFEEELKDRADKVAQEATDGAGNGSKRSLAIVGEPGYYGTYDISVVARARRVHQSIWTAPWSSFLCLSDCFHSLRRPAPASSSDPLRNVVFYPDIVLTNGPGSAVIMVLAANIVLSLSKIPFLSRYLQLPKKPRVQSGSDTFLAGRGKLKTVYVESWARVRRLSLSGKILLRLRLCDRFLVQWKGLLACGKEGRGRGVMEYAGWLV